MYKKNAVGSPANGVSFARTASGLLDKRQSDGKTDQQAAEQPLLQALRPWALVQPLADPGTGQGVAAVEQQPDRHQRRAKPKELRGHRAGMGIDELRQ